MTKMDPESVFRALLDNGHPATKGGKFSVLVRAMCAEFDRVRAADAIAVPTGTATFMIGAGRGGGSGESGGSTTIVADSTPRAYHCRTADCPSTAVRDTPARCYLCGHPMGRM